MSGGARLALVAALVLAAGCTREPSVSRIVFVTLDTVRADRLGCYGYAGAHTPNLDALAAEAGLFEQASSAVPVTLPAHSTMFTGLYPQDHGVRYNLFYRLQPSAETLAEVLHRAGWATAAFPASQIVGQRFGLDQGFDTWAEPPDEHRPDLEHPVAGNCRSAEEGVDLALEWLSGHRGERSFVWLHFYDPHFPYDPPFPWSSQFRDRPYDGEIAYVDAQFGRLVQKLREDEAWPQTLILVAGDHGEGLYEHGERWHTMLAYETTQHVPLLVRAPGSDSRRIDVPVTLADLMPTALDYAGLTPPAATRGTSLRPAIEGRGLPARRDLYMEAMAGSIVYGWAELHALRSGPWKLIDSADPELYELESDPRETTNLAAREPQRLAELRAALADLTRPVSGAEAPAAATVELDAETQAMLESLGYVGGGGGGSVEAAPHPRLMIDLEPELLTAQTAVARGNWEYLEDLCHYTLERDPTNKWALAQMTTALVQQGRLDEALEHARLMPRIYPQGQMAWQKLADVWMAKGEPQQAWDTLQEGIRRMPEPSEQLEFLALAAGFDAGRKVICTDDVPRIVASYPKSGRMLVLKARCEARQGEPDTALATLERAVALGFRHFDVLEEATDFAKVVALPRYTALREGVENDTHAVPGGHAAPARAGSASG